MNTLPMLTINENRNSTLRYMNFDNYYRRNFLVVFGYALLTVERSRFYWAIAGNIRHSGYKEGKSLYSRYGVITGVLLFPEDKNKVWIADHTNGCIRHVNRKSLQSAELVGKCTESLVKDGNFSVAGIGEPIGLLYYTRDDVFFFENKEPSVRRIHKLHGKWVVETIYIANRAAKYIALDPHKKYVYMTHSAGVSRINEEGETLIIESKNGHHDGPIKEAKTRELGYMMFLSNDLFMVVDTGNNVIRVVDLYSSLVSTICVPQTSEPVSVEGIVDRCRIQKPIYLLDKSKYSFVWVLGKRGYYQLFYDRE